MSVYFTDIPMIIKIPVITRHLQTFIFLHISNRM